MNQKDTDWAAYAEAVAADIFGACNEALSAAPENVRFGNNGSVSINYTDGTWYDYENECGGGVKELIRVYRNIEDRDAVIAYAEECREKFENGAKPRPNGNNGANYQPRPQHEIEAIYPYRNASGQTAFEVLRVIFPQLGGGYATGANGKRSKTFLQRRPSGDPDGSWLWGLEAGEYMRTAPGKSWVRFKTEQFEAGPAGKERKTFTTSAPIIPYRLIELMTAIAAAKTIYVVEGEKKADLLYQLGFVATCCAGGAKKWQPEHTAFLQGADVVLLPDNDPAGREHVEKIADSLAQRAKRLRVLELPYLPVKGDVVDWHAGGGTAQQLEALTTAAPDYAGDGGIEPLPLTRELPKADEFPLEVLGSLAKAAQAICDLVQSPIEMCAGAVLASVSFAASAHVNVLLPTGEIKPASSWFWTIAPSGERKTATDDRAFAAYKRREKELREQHEIELAAYEAQFKIWEAQDKAIAKEFRATGAAGSEAHQIAVDALGPEPEEPLGSLLISSEFTFEGLVNCLKQGQPLYGIIGSEGGQFLGGHGMTEEAKKRTISGLSAAWDGEPIKRIRVNETTVLPGRRVGMHLMVQPRMALAALNDAVLKDQGFLSRILVCAPKELAGTRLYKLTPPEAESNLQAYEDRVLAILQMPYPLAVKQNGEKRRNELAPRLVAFCEDAKKLFRDFGDNTEKEQKPGGEYEDIKPLANKLKEHAARLAVALAYYDRPDVKELTEDNFRRGMCLVSYYATEATRIACSGDYAEPENVVDKYGKANALKEWLQSDAWKDGDTVSARDIYSFGPRTIRNRATALAAAEILVQHQYLTRATSSRRNTHEWKIKKEKKT